MGEGIEHNNEKAPQNGREFLEKLQSREVIVNDSSVAVVVAHPDDESIGFGAQFGRFPGCLTVHVTDGAPRNPSEWEKKGFTSREEYKEVRSVELNNALDIAGHTGLRLSLNISDQEAAFKLVETAENLARIFTAGRIQFVLTHAYEGGHPDHDSVAFAVHAAKEIMKREGCSLNIIEAPFYRGGESKNIWQSFVDVSGAETCTLSLSKEESDLKDKIFAAYESQREVFGSASTTTELLREAPHYDFKELPNGGKLSRIFQSAELTPLLWKQLTVSALTVLGIVRSKENSF